jgi:hypothetical protein
MGRVRQGCGVIPVTSSQVSILKPVALETRWRAVDAALQNAIDTVTAEIHTHEHQQGKRLRRRKAQDSEKFERAIEVIVCNFVAISKVEPGRPLMVRLGNYASASSSIYGRHFNGAVDLMADLGLLTKKIGYRVGSNARAPSCIMPTPRLASCLPKIDGWSALRLEQQESLITLGSKEGDDLASPLPTAQLEPWLRAAEADIAQINAHLRQADIEGDPRGIVHLADVPGSIADFLMTPHHRTVRRIFKGSYQHGGRLFGGWWETLERSKRFHIRINGENVANVDYGQLYLRLAYAFSEQSPPPGDLYDLSGTDHRCDDWQMLRDGRKTLVNALFFTAKPLTRWPGKTAKERAAVRDCFPPDTKPREVAEAIKERHHAVAEDWFERGRGLELMRQESDMLVAVLLRLISIGITALPLHDSVLVARKDGPLAKRAMEDVAKMLTGAEIPVKIETGQECG